MQREELGEFANSRQSFTPKARSQRPIARHRALVTLPVPRASVIDRFSAVPDAIDTLLPESAACVVILAPRIDDVDHNSRLIGFQS